MAIYSFLVLCGQAVATLLGRVYYDKGGKSKWLATLVQLVGFPLLLPCYCTSMARNSSVVKNTQPEKRPSTLVLAFVYTSLGLLAAANCLLYSIGLLYLPVSTYSLICASQLAFNAFFAFFLNSQKFTPFIANSLLLLTISSTLLIFESKHDENPSGISKGKFVIGFMSTLGASAGYGLVLSLIQLSFAKVIKRETFSAVLDMNMYQCLVATCATLVGLFASGEWKSLTGEMENFKSGKSYYVLNLTVTALSWQAFSIGSIGLIFEVSSLFSNIISVLGLPIIPFLAVIFFHDNMDGLKVISMILAIWGFISYAYQQYLDEAKSKAENRNIT